MKHNINGRLWGIGQFIFWLILIPWIIIIIPLNYYYETHTAPDWLANLYRQDWIKWEYGLMIIMSIIVLSLLGALMWIGWQLMHPITQQHIKTNDEKRLKLVKEFSKENYMKKIYSDAKEYHKKRFWQK